MPVKDMYSLVEEARERFEKMGIDEIKTTVGYGHIGDGESLSPLRSHENETDPSFRDLQVICISTLSQRIGAQRLRRLSSHGFMRLPVCAFLFSSFLLIKSLIPRT